MNKYLISIDLDGTLLNDQKKISKKNLEYLQQLDRRGHLVVIATGRPLSWVKEYYQELNLNSPIVCFNGSLIKERDGSSYPSVYRYFPKELIYQIWDKIYPYAENILMQNEKKLYQLKDDPFLSFYPWVKKFLEDYEIITGDIYQTLNSDPLTILIRLKANYDQKLILRLINELNLNIGVRFWEEAPYMEIYYNDISKYSALMEVAKRYEIKKENIVALGDSSNDIEMMKYASISIAMLNGNKEIQKLATKISKYDNNHDGVYYALKEIFN